MTAQISIVLQEVKGVKVIPFSAIKKNNKKNNKEVKNKENKEVTSNPEKVGKNSGVVGKQNRKTGNRVSNIYTVKVLTLDNQVVEKDIEIGLNNNIQVEVVSGLELGEKVILGQSTNAPPVSARNPLGGGRQR